MDLQIFIPTLGRIDRQATLENIPNKLLPITWLVVDSEEFEEFDRKFDDHINIMVCPHKGIAKVRKFIMERATSRHVMYMSDDLRFYHRGNLSESGEYFHLEDNNSKQTCAMVELLYRWLEAGFAHVGVSPRQFNRHCPATFKDVDRMHDLYAYDKHIFTEEKIKWNRVPVMEDMDVTLQLLTKGYRNRVSYRYVWNQYGSNAKGGCSTYRDYELQAAAAEKMERLWPDFVTVVERKVKGWGPMNIRKDIRVQWKKAYKEGQNAGA